MESDVEGKLPREKTTANRWPDGGPRTGAWGDSRGAWEASGGESPVGGPSEEVGYGRRLLLGAMVMVVRYNKVVLWIDFADVANTEG